MTDLDTKIAAKHAEAARLREELPRLADDLCAASAGWASKMWDDIIRGEIADQPEVAKRRKDDLPRLKSDLASLRETAAEEAHKHLQQSVLLHETFTDEKLASLVTPGSWHSEALVSLPRNSSRSPDEAFRKLIGAIGPALSAAGLLGPESRIDHAGRYTVGFRLPDHVEGTLSAYEARLSDLARVLFEAKELELEKARAEAQSLWDDA